MRSSEDLNLLIRLISIYYRRYVHEALGPKPVPLKLKVFLAFHLCLGRPISRLPRGCFESQTTYIH